MEPGLQLLSQASNEIKMARQRMAIMSARLNMFDDMMLIFKTQPRQIGESCAPDLVYEIDEFVKKELEAKVSK